MSGYTIAAIPTLYRGRMYRSRLEARWAAFFDRLGWGYEYEPFDMGKWSPDFLLVDLNVLVEVKPLTDFDPTVFHKIASVEYPGVYGFLLTRVAPDFSGWCAQIGWLKSAHQPQQEDCYAYPASVMWFLEASCPVVKPHIWAAGDGSDWTTGWGVLDDDDRRYPYKEYVAQLWADASNAVQWEPTR